MKKIVVIVGAGASFDSAMVPAHMRGSAWRPPLVDGLFEIEYLRLVEVNWPQNYNRLHALISEFKTTPEPRSIEDFLSRKYQSIVGGKLPPVTASATMDAILQTVQYLRSLFYGVTYKYIKDLSYYHALVSRLAQQYDEIWFVSFNYDELLERAIWESLGIQYRKLDDYIAHPYKLIKPHGTISWRYRKIHELWDQGEVSEKRKVLESYSEEDIEVNLSQPALEKDYFPCMVLPLHAHDAFFKKRFVCPREHIQALAEAIVKIEQYLVIGWSGREEHFNKLLKDNLYGYDGSSLYVVGYNEGAEETIREVENYYSDWERKGFYGGGFGNFLTEPELLEKELGFKSEM